LATELLFIELMNDPFLVPLLGTAGSDELALLEAEQATIDQAALAAGLGANLNIVI